jgi:hypothetical protein
VIRKKMEILIKLMVSVKINILKNYFSKIDYKSNGNSEKFETSNKEILNGKNSF